MKNLLNRYIKDESGATAIEYVLILGLISLAIIVGANLLGTNLNTKFTDVAGEVQGVDLRDATGN